MTSERNRAHTNVPGVFGFGFIGRDLIQAIQVPGDQGFDPEKGFFDEAGNARALAPQPRGIIQGEWAESERGGELPHFPFKLLPQFDPELQVFDFIS